MDADWMMGRNEEKRGILPIGFIDIVVPLPEDSLKVSEGLAINVMRRRVVSYPSVLSQCRL